MSNLFKTFSTGEIYVDFNQPQAIPSIYGIGDSRIGKFFLEGEEGFDEEMLRFIEKSGSFDFLSNPDEDMYSFDDGESIC